MRVTQSAALPWRRLADGGIAVLLVTSRRTRRWIVPKGHIERGMTAAASAEKEALEEAGVIGEIGAKVGTFEYDKLLASGAVRRLRVSVFPLAVTGELESWEERDLRERAWFAPDDAAAATAEPELQAIIRRFAAQQGV